MTLIDTEMAAVMLDVSPRWVQHLVSVGDLTNHGTPRRILLDIDEVSRRTAQTPD